MLMQIYLPEATASLQAGECYANAANKQYWLSLSKPYHSGNPSTPLRE